MQLETFSRWIARAAALAVMSVALSACDEMPTAPGPDDLSGPWRLTSLQSRSAPAVTPRPGVPMGIEFIGDRITIRSDCNACSGTFSASSGTFSVSRLICTLRACTSESLEGPFLELLTTANTISVVTGRALTLDGPNGSLTFER